MEPTYIFKGHEVPLYRETLKYVQGIQWPVCNAEQGDLCTNGGTLLRHSLSYRKVGVHKEREEAFKALSIKGVSQTELTLDFDPPFELIPDIENKTYLDCKDYSDESILYSLSQCLYTSDIGDFANADRTLGIFRKAMNAMWRWGCGRDFKTAVKFYRGLQNFNFGEGFQVRIDRATGFNPKSWAMYHREVFLDGAFGLIIYRNGTRVLTIGITPTKWGLLVHQVQGTSRQFKTPAGLTRIDHVLNQLREAFDMPLLLVDGELLSRSISLSYTNSKMPPLADSVHKRIVKQYNGPLGEYKRGPVPVKVLDQAFYPLHPKRPHLY